MAPNYYKTNALYEYIEENNLSEYTFAKENLWITIYGDIWSVPKLILVISAVSDEDYDNSIISQHERDIIELCVTFAAKSSLEYRVVRYRKSEWPLQNIQYMDYPSQCVEVPAHSLVQLFERNGIRPSAEGTSKDLNDKAASAFHLWQRTYLGRNMTVSDIDLIKTDENGHQSIYELKRSFYQLEDWTPFDVDYTNFRLVSRFADMIGASFQIIYNRRDKDPFRDDISMLKRFSFSPEEGAKYIDTVSLNDFIGGGGNE